jgi:hypothetical protein
MHLYRVAVTEPPAPGKRKGWLHHFAVVAVSEASAIQRVRDECPGYCKDATDIVAFIEPTRVAKVMSVRPY